MGKYIIIEGDEGSGKTTQVELLAKRLRGLGREVECVREPGGDPLGELMRSVLKASPDDKQYLQLRDLYFDGQSVEISTFEEALGFLLARVGMLARVVYPKLVDGQIVLSDQGTVSTLVYQGLAGNLDLKFLRLICDHVANVAPPTVTIVLDVPLAVSQARQVSRGLAADRFESRGEQYRQAINDGYRKVANEDLHPLIDANQSIREVHEQIWSVVRPML